MVRFSSLCGACFRFVRLMGLLVLALPAVGQAQFTYVTNNGAIVITSYTGIGGAVTIPDEIGGLPVTGIANWAFAHSPNLTSITFSNNLTAVGMFAFEECPNLTSVTMGTGVTSIGGSAFQNCPSLNSITIPDSVTNLGIVVFAGCTGLTNAVVGNGVPTIGYRAFALCWSLVSVTLGTSVTSIELQAFDYCTNLVSVAIPASVTSIDPIAFAGCLNLTAINVDANNLFYASEDGVLFSAPRNWLLQCPMGKAGSYTIPESVISIEPHAFENCRKLTSVSIPDNVYVIREAAFSYCMSLTNISIGNGITTLGNQVFYSCSSLTSITFPTSIQSIGSEALGSCAKLESVFFRGDAPDAGGNALGVTPTVYYLPGTAKWLATYSGRPTALWNPTPQTAPPDFGVHSNHFGFTIAGTPNIPLVVEAATNLTDGHWTPLQTCTLTNGSIYFSDPDWTNYPSRFYRLRFP